MKDTTEILTDALTDSLSCQEIPFEHNRREHEVNADRFLDSIREESLGARLMIAKEILEDTGIMFQIGCDRVSTCPKCGGVWNISKNICDCGFHVDFSEVPF